MAENPHYGRAPILEAIIELKFEDVLSDRDFERIQNRFKGDYPSVEERQTVQVEVGPKGVVTNSQPAGFKMTAKNAVDVILVTRDRFASTRLAPYDRWETFQGKAKDNFDEFTKIAGRKKITRIGVRYINRFDIPVKELEGQPLSKFIKVGIAIPPDITKIIGNFNMNAAGIEASTGANLALQCGMLPPALLGHTSISLDIDVSWEKNNISGRLDELWASTEVLRKAKNLVFETSITDALRAFIR